MARPTPERTCISCRRKGGKGDFIKLVNTPAGVAIDYRERLQARGAYICPEKDCIARGLKEQTLSRAFKARVRPPDADAFHAELVEKVERKIASLLGMARKSGSVRMGFDAAIEGLAKCPGGLLLTARDISGNTEDRLAEKAGPDAARRAAYSTKEGLGAILGVSPVGVVYVQGPELAAAIEKEIRRLINVSGG